MGGSGGNADGRESPSRGSASGWISHGWVYPPCGETQKMAPRVNHISPQSSSISSSSSPPPSSSAAPAPGTLSADAPWPPASAAPLAGDRSASGASSLTAAGCEAEGSPARFSRTTHQSGPVLLSLAVAASMSRSKADRGGTGSVTGLEVSSPELASSRLLSTSASQSEAIKDTGSATGISLFGEGGASDAGGLIGSASPSCTSRQ
mmetsp:Transcript_25360/g.71116  ORF Transcript_25360/g.71116 Transcript_25360/m.71116 type:complete len:206 (+) Transcript_25360:895-1512(+)